MRPFVCGLFLVGLLFVPVSLTGAPAPKAAKEEAIKADVAKLQGRWRVVSFQKDGEERSADSLQLMDELTFKDRDYYWGDRDTPSGAIDDIDPTEKPKRITYKSAWDTHEYGIYLIEGDVFMDCFADTEKKRPTEFTSKPDSGHTLVVYKRVKKDD